jgi:hypothetical protein
MKISSGVVGIDYHLKSLQVTVLQGDGSGGVRRRLANCTLSLIDYLRQQCDSVRLVALEASTGSNEFAWELKAATGWDVRLCYPGYVRRMRHNPEKSDLQDADLIADLAQVGYLPQVWLAPVDVRERRAVVRYRDGLTQEKMALKLKIKALLRDNRVVVEGQPWGTKSLWTKKGLAWLEELSVGVETTWILRGFLEQLSSCERRLKAADAQVQRLFDGDPLAQELAKEVGVGVFSSLHDTEFSTNGFLGNCRDVCGLLEGLLGSTTLPRSQNGPPPTLFFETTIMGYEAAASMLA